MLMLLISLVVMLPASLEARHTLPVFIIDKDRAVSDVYKDPNPFDKVGSLKFEEIIHEAIRNSEAIVLFIEETFSVEDISHKDKKGSPYFYLRQSVQEGKTKYLPAVVDPYRLLTQIFEPHKSHVFHLRARTKLELLETFKYIYIYFEDGMNETRIDSLRRHDSIIKEVCYVVQQIKNGPIVAFYTGKGNPVAAKKMHFVPIKPIPIPTDLGVMVVSSGALFRFSGVYAATPTRRAIFTQLPMIAAETVARRTMTTRMAYIDFELEFNFSFKESGWTLDDVTLLEAGEEVGRTDMSIGAPWNMSYVCGEPLVIINTRDGSVVTISSYQIQPRMTGYHSLESKEPLRSEGQNKGGRSGTNGGGGNGGGANGGGANGGGGGLDDPKNKTDFGKSKSCGPFFNTAILSTLFVTGVCMSILFFGIVSMMSIRTNDRYEDPLGKQWSNPDA